MFLLLVGSGLIYFVLGDLAEALMLMSFVLVIIGITVYQEQKTERALEALRNLSSPRALVIRDGEQRRIPGRDVIRGDMLILAEGDRVPADGVLIAATNVSVDESLLTGESVPVRKVPWTGGVHADRPGGDDQPFVYSGTLVVQGQGLVEVRSTGARTEMGKIGAVLQTVTRGETRLTAEISRIVRTVAVIGLSLCAIIVVVYGLSRGDWIEGLLAGITLAMAILPEEFPVVLTVFLALGAWRLSLKNVLTRQVPAIETLGSATVLCVDKTGTLTENRMTVHTFFAQGQMCEYDAGANSVPEVCHEIPEFAILASKKDPFDPMEKALLHLRDGDFGTTEHIHAGWELVHGVPALPRAPRDVERLAVPRRRRLHHRRKGGSRGDLRSVPPRRGGPEGPGCAGRRDGRAGAPRPRNGKIVLLQAAICLESSTTSPSPSSGSSGSPTPSARRSRRP